MHHTKIKHKKSRLCNVTNIKGNFPNSYKTRKNQLEQITWFYFYVFFSGPKHATKCLLKSKTLETKQNFIGRKKFLNMAYLPRRKHALKLHRSDCSEKKKERALNHMTKFKIKKAPLLQSVRFFLSHCQHHELEIKA